MNIRLLIGLVAGMAVGMAVAPSYPEHAALHVALKNARLSHYHYAYPSGSGALLWHFPEWLKVINDKFHD